MTFHAEYHREIAELRARCEYLEAENRRLRGTAHVPSSLRLKRALNIRLPEASLLVALSDGKEHSYARLAAAVGSRGSNIENLISSYSSRLRRKFKWLRITTIYGFGLMIEDAESLSSIRNLMRET